MRKSFYLLTFLCLFCISNTYSQKHALSHDDYDSWQEVTGQKISHNARFVSYQLSPQVGDAKLFIHDLKEEKKYIFDRGAGVRMNNHSDFIVFKVNAPADSVRYWKYNKKDVPADTMAVWFPGQEDLFMEAGVKSYQVSPKSPWMAYQYQKENKKSKQQGKLKVYNPFSGTEYIKENVHSYLFPEEGKSLFYQVKDSSGISGVFCFDPEKSEEIQIWHSKGEIKTLEVNETGDKLSFLFSEDTTNIKDYSMYLWEKGMTQAQEVIHSENEAMPDNWLISQYSRLSFTRSGEKIFFQIAPAPVPEKKDTLLESEKVIIDIWNWKDKAIQPMQLKNVSRELRKNYLAVYDLEKKKMVQLGSEDLENVMYSNDLSTENLLAYDYQPYLEEVQWDTRYSDVYLVNVENGEKEKILSKHEGYVRISPAGKYLAWFDAAEGLWYIRNNNSGEQKCLNKEIDVCFYNELHDTPRNPSSYGLIGWDEKEEYVYVYDRYDIWSFSMESDDYNCVTNSYGRKHSTSYRLVSLDPEEKYISFKKGVILKYENQVNMESGFVQFKPGKKEPFSLLCGGKYTFSYPRKAKEENKMIWTRESYNESPDLWISALDFSDTKQLSFINPQQKDFVWSKPELVSFLDHDGDPVTGLVYYPENFDPDKKYPMMVKFYERQSDQIYSYIAPAPHRSVINETFYASNGYIVFLPDIKYREGYPGQSAYKAVVSGTVFMANKPFVDESRIGVQGQSWGGYQIAYLVTQTDIFRAAMAGAPVSNMISAYGGIRWASGMSRMFQYEKTQSRIGGTLWEKPLHYIENSPIFYLEKVNTPLLMRHCDEDGAVPWYQGIEMFVGLKRLKKPVWLLNYNGAPHNLTKKRANRLDLAIRMKQFFDHYLKDAPAPVWMEKGIPATLKGKTLGYELIKNE